MAVDAKIELFACELFTALWSEYPCGRVDFPLEIVIDSEVPLESEMNNDILTAVKCRRSLFYNILNTQFLRNYDYFCDSTCDFYAYLRKSFPSNEILNVPVTEVVLATCTFTLEMCIFATSYDNYLFVNICHLVWAMYFDTELKPRFYAEGGWSALKRAAQSYILCYNFLTEHNNICTRKRGTSISLWPVERNIAAIADFMQFTGKDCTDKDIKLNTKFIHHCIADNDKPFPKTAVVLTNCKASSLNYNGVEYLLLCMRIVCDRYRFKLIEYDRKIALGEVPPRVFYEPKTGKKFTIDEMRRKTLGSQYTKSHSDDVRDQSETPVKEDKRIYVKKDRLEEIKSSTGPDSPSKARNLENQKSPFCAAFEDDLQNNLESVLSELDINAKASVNTILPNRYSPTIPGQRNILKPRRRLSAGKENSHSQIPFSQKLASKGTPSIEVLSPQRKIVNTAEKRKTAAKAPRNLTSINPKMQSKSEILKFMQESSTKIYQATELGSVESKISMDEVSPTKNKIITKQTHKIVSTLNKMHPTKGNFETEIKASEETSNESKKLGEDRNERIQYHIKDILRMMLVLGSPPGIRFVRSTLHNSNKEKGKKKTNKIFF